MCKQEQEIRRDEREKIAQFIQEGQFAPVSYYGGCLECGEWTPPNHPERWPHKESCSWNGKEFRGDEYLARLIRGYDSNAEE